MRTKSNLFFMGLILVSSIGLMSCSEGDKKSSGNWGLRAPLFETGDKSELQPFEAVTSSKSTLKLKSTDKLVFTDAAEQKGVSLSAKTFCTLPQEQQVVVETVSISLASKISIFEILPIELLYQPTGNIPAEVSCKVKLVARNKSGSTHDFGDAVSFVVLPPDTSQLIALESRTAELAVGHSLGYKGISTRDSYNVYLPTLARGENFWLKCQNFEVRSAQKQTLAQILDQNKNSGDLKADQLCRLFVESRGVIKNMSNFFMLMIFNVDNLVDNVEMSSPLRDPKDVKVGFRVATVTFYNKTNTVYYARLEAPSIPTLVKARFHSKPSQSIIQIQPIWNASGNLLVLQPNQSAKVSVQIPLSPLCKMGETVSLTVNEQRPLPVIQVSSKDPRNSKTFETELSIPALEPSGVPVTFETGLTNAKGPGGGGRIKVYKSVNCN